MSFIDTCCFLVFSWLCNHVYAIMLMPGCSRFCNKMLLSTVLNAFFLICKTAIEDHELFIVVVKPATNSNIAIRVFLF